MKTDEFDYHLPEELIAQTPVEPRDASRLLVLDRAARRAAPPHFVDLPAYLRAGDLLVANDSRVIPARLYGHREARGGKVEALLLHPRTTAAGRRWCARAGACARARRWCSAERRRTRCRPTVEARTPSRRAGCCASRPAPRACWTASASPRCRPTSTRRWPTPERYQTVYARERGSVAAPTAGLHFTPELLARLAGRGVGFAFITLHIGLDTFRPVQDEEVERAPHPLRVLRAGRRDGRGASTPPRAAGRRVVAVGTTAVRTLETAARGRRRQASAVAPFAGWTNLFIYPGYRFRARRRPDHQLPPAALDLLMLVSAFAGRDFVLPTPTRRPSRASATASTASATRC